MRFAAQYSAVMSVQFKSLPSYTDEYHATGEDESGVLDAGLAAQPHSTRDLVYASLN